ncbi:glycosyltransferase [Sutcliffiella horikoshii]|uniref:glycosyltransferase n=1 Tax=Sutcliffiella horikoshii TaxID=79883 RepID=UPI003CF2D11C
MNNKKNIHVIVATGEWDQDNLRYRRHRLAEYLESHPDTEEVIWVCPSITKHAESFRLLENGIKQYTVNDIHSHKLSRFGRYFDNFYKGKLQRLKKYLDGKSTQSSLYLWCTFPGFPGMVDLCAWKETIYDCSDYWASSITGNKNIVLMMREKSILQAEKRIAENVDTIFCTSDFLYENLKQEYNIKADQFVMENGVEYDLFQTSDKPTGVERKSDLVLGFIGGIKPKLDFDMLYRLMSLKSNWELLLVGPDGTDGHPDFKKLQSLNNVNWVGKVPPMEVPHYMNALDIGILPYKKSPYNNAVFPLKLFEFLGAGKPVVGMNLPSTQKFSEPNVYEYLINDTVDNVIETCETLTSTSNASIVKRRKELAASKDWNNIFEKMYQIVMK